MRGVLIWDMQTMHVSIYLCIIYISLSLSVLKLPLWWLLEPVPGLHRGQQGLQCVDRTPCHPNHSPNTSWKGTGLCRDIYCIKITFLENHQQYSSLLLYSFYSFPPQKPHYSIDVLFFCNIRKTIIHISNSNMNRKGNNNGTIVANDKNRLVD